MSTWLEIVDCIDSFGKNLTDWEKKFIADIVDNPPKNFSEKQIKIIKRIYDEKV
jgi:hypothetical protein